MVAHRVSTRNRLTWWLVARGAGLVLLLAVPLVVKARFPMHVLIMTFVYGVLGEAWNILGGYAGQISLGQTVYFGIGAYTSSMLFTTLDVNPWLGMLVGAAAAVLLSIVAGYPTVRISGKYFVIASIALLNIVQVALVNTDAVGGAAGLLIPMLPESWKIMQFHSGKAPYYYIALGMLALAVATCAYVDRSKIGYYFRTIRESEEVAESLGIDTVRYKLYAAGLSAFLCAIVGTLYAQYLLYIDPVTVVSLPMATEMCLIAILGGVGTVWGPVLGAAVLVPLSEVTRAYLGGRAGGVDIILYAMLIILIIIYQPGGVLRILQSVDLFIDVKGRSGVDRN
jgi:branched-chain amino acid transport system permease protein